MGACERSDEPAGTEETRICQLGERVGDCIIEPQSSSDNGLDVSPRLGDGPFVQSVLEKPFCSESGHGLVLSGAEYVKTVDGCGKSDEEDPNVRALAVFDCSHTDEASELENVSSIEHGLSKVPFDEKFCQSEMDPSPSNLEDCPDDWVKRFPCSESGSQALPRGSDSVLQSVSKNHCFSVSDHGLGETGDSNRRDGCSRLVDGDKIFEAITDFDHSHADVNNELGNVSNIELGLKSKNEMNPCPSNQLDHPDEHKVSSKLLQVSSAHTVQNKSDCTTVGDIPSGETFVEVVSTMAFTGVLDDGPSNSTMMPDVICVAAINFNHVFKSADHLEKENEGNGGSDGSVSKVDSTDAPASLRRSSRTRKCVQNVQGGKHSTKSTKKVSNVSRCGTIDLLSKATRKKRSCLSRSLCLSGWGMSGNLSKYFECSNDVTVNKVLDKVSKRRNTGQTSKKKNKLKVVACSQTSESIQGVPRRPIRLKVTFGKKEEHKKLDIVPPDVTNAQPFHYSNDGNQPDLCSNTERTAEKSTYTDTVQLEHQKLVGPHVDKYMDPGTSPDSEVIDHALDSNVAQSALKVIHSAVNNTSNGAAVSGNASSSLPCKKSKKKKSKKDKLSEVENLDVESNLLCQAAVDKAKKKKRNKKDKLCEASNLSVEGKALCRAKLDKAKSRKDGPKKLSNAFCFKDPGFIAPSENPSSNTSGSELISAEPLSVSEKAPHEGPSLDNGVDSNVCSDMPIGIGSASGNSCQLLSPDGAQGKGISEGSKAKKKKSRNKSKVIDATEKQKKSSGQLKGGKRKGGANCKISVNESLDGIYNKGSESQTGKYAPLDLIKTDTGHGVMPKNVSCLDVLPCDGGNQILPQRNAWVCCDDCHKWRCIPAELADTIEETHCKWTCKDNQDQAFADCSIPQEKSNAEINADLQISDEEDGRDGHRSKSCGIKHGIASQPSTWRLIKSNLFMHRSRKTQTMDEIMVCHCKLSADGRSGCGNHCLNRMLNIECVRGTCPCGDLCSNQQFQKRQYAKLNWFRCGKKGYGLQALEDISKGQFLIEYVGEVLDLQAYEARQKEYASKGYKHFYFMTLNGNEVIDACSKGNLGRFVNHSCDPNCRTEKWVVNGEICVGLFALRSIRKGEELTFDYNYVRVFGAAAKKCHCGSSKCQGYIGGDPQNAEVVVQDDSDEEFPEPVVLDENGVINHTQEDTKSGSQDVELVPNAEDICQENLQVKTLDVILEDGNKVGKIYVECQSPTLDKKQGSDGTHGSSENLTAAELVRVGTEMVSTIDQLNLTKEHSINTSISSTVSEVLPMKKMVKKSISGSTDSSGRISEVDTVDCEPSLSKHPRMKISRPSKTVKSRKTNSNSSVAEKLLVTDQKSQVLSYKPRKLSGGAASCHLEAVEEKLNELLDADGGICKRKDASRGYLKLLLLTAASGDSGNGGAIQSNRDLSMILDAMLKTKSRGVLLDIINKNGLQMLHNMMKLYRRDFKKIPILRKLLKVLEYLAQKEILTVERINEDPLCPGVESFRESILSFTEHEDKKVHQIARNFRDRWVPRPIRKFNGIEKPDRKREFNRSSNSNRSFGTHHHWREHGVRPTEAIDCIKQSALSSNPIDSQHPEASSVHLNITDAIINRPRKRKSRWDQDKEPNTSPQKMKTSPTGDTSGGINQDVEATEDKTCSQILPEPMQTSEDDAPPGFSSPCISEDDAPPGFSSFSPLNSSPLKCPTVFMGYPQERFNSHLTVSYGIPLTIMQQFGSPQSGVVDAWDIAPAIPFHPFPPLPPCPREKVMVANQGVEERRRDQGIPSTSVIVQSNFQNPGSTNPRVFDQDREVMNGLGRRYNRQQKWSNQPKWRRPWSRRKDGWGLNGNHNHPRNRMSMGTTGNGQNVENLVNVNHSVDLAGNSC